MNKDTLILTLIAVAVGVFLWIYVDPLSSLLGGGVFLEKVRQKKRATKVKSQEADKRQEVHQENSQEHADKAVKSQQEAHDVAEQKDEPVKERSGFVKKVFRSE